VGLEEASDLVADPEQAPDHVVRTRTPARSRALRTVRAALPGVSGESGSVGIGFSIPIPRRCRRAQSLIAAG
jgi:hypothetical protein